MQHRKNSAALAPTVCKSIYIATTEISVQPVSTVDVSAMKQSQRKKNKTDEPQRTR
jgi:hypothetical protein